MLPAPQDICTTAHAKSALPESGFVNVLSMKPSTVTTAPLYNASVPGQYFYAGAIFENCDVTFAYSYTGRNNPFWLELWLLAPEKFQNRWLSTGGGVFAINSDPSIPAGSSVHYHDLFRKTMCPHLPYNDGSRASLQSE